MERYIEDKRNLYALIHEFLEESDEHNDNKSRDETLEKLIKIIRSQQIEVDGEEMLQFLEIIKSIGENHRRDQHFNEGINQLLLHYKDQIKQTLSNPEIFHIFENNKKIVLFLIKKDIITISDEIYREMINKIETNGNRYWHFFIPELEQFVGEDKMKIVKNELLKNDPTFFTKYEEKREEGENDSYICSLIRQDSIEEFVKYVNRLNISPSSEILPSNFETNPFLIDKKNTTLIEYSAFFGSIQIFQYLMMNKVELNPSLWLYTIHSKNAELIHLLESNKIPLPKSDNNEEEEEKVENSIQNYEQCLIESIKCHHNDITDYIENSFIDQAKKVFQQNEEIISNCIKYHNYTHFQDDIIINNGFFYLSFYHYDKLFELLLKKKENSIEKKMIQYQDIRTASENSETEVIYHYLLKMQEISRGLFNDTKIKQITIPSSVVLIGNNSFWECSSLTQIAIPSSVASIGDYSFSGCSSLTQITIPSSVTSIGNYAFRGCSSLTQITIPSSVTSIGDYAFRGCSSLDTFSVIQCKKKLVEYYDGQFLLYKSNPNSEIYDTLLWAKLIINTAIIPTFITKISSGSFLECSSLTQITIPSSVTSIGDYTFIGCSSLTQITIPSSVTSIGKFAFSGCSSLTQIAIPSSITSILDYTFSGCSSLTQVSIPSSVTSIGDYSFSICSSLTQITIPSSVTSIGNDAFSECSSLTQISIPSSVTSFRNYTFSGCSSLTQITIPSSVTSIGEFAFSGCSSLTQITIPSSVTSIENDAFSGCLSLTQITIPSSVTSIEDYTFFGCSSLIKITIPSSVTSIGDYTFFGCSSLIEITIPTSVTSIGDYTFSGCLSLAQISIPSSVAYIGEYTFKGCSSLTQISIPSSIDIEHLGLDPNTIINIIQDVP